MTVLGIETSCDETAAAVVRSGTDVLASNVSSQVSLHAGYGGVVPELAAREHLRNIMPVVSTALDQSGLALHDLSAVAVTCGPGLIPALVVGVSYAKGLASAAELPLVGVNHFLAHIYGAFIEHDDLLQDPGSFPILALLVSGGHTALVLIEATGAAHIVGTTLDDAAGEAFDKAAKILNLGYPGGPVIDRLAAQGDPKHVAFPRSLTGEGGRPLKPENRFNFSFSGVKTALLYHVRDRSLSDAELVDVVASYQAAVVDVLVRKTAAAAEKWQTPTIVLCGGVACNSRLRADMADAADQAGKRFVPAPPRYCTDNAAMVAGYAHHALAQGVEHDLEFTVSARLNPELGRVPFVP